jgi:multifunctional 2-oxoglutarate metabolism enzyme
LLSRPQVSTPTPAQAQVKPVPVLVTPSAATMEPLRGVAGRVVASMEASLSVPTATSVRAIPAKLMIDNRTVITNHLKRTRGGKVSFTHIIAYAMIKALRQMPEMNVFYGEVDGKPALGKSRTYQPWESQSIWQRLMELANYWFHQLKVVKA